MSRPDKRDRAQTTGSPDPPAGRKPYRAPVLIVHGRVKDLTQTKHGNNNDGAGKPRTRASGVQS